MLAGVSPRLCTPESAFDMLCSWPKVWLSALRLHPASPVSALFHTYAAPLSRARDRDSNASKSYVSGRRLSKDLLALPGKNLRRHINARVCSSIAGSKIQIGIFQQFSR